MNSPGRQMPPPENTTADGDSGPELRSVPLRELAPEVLGRGGDFTFIATGLSMWPFIRHGDTVTTVPLAPEERPRAGCVIIYSTAGGGVAVHRVIRAYSGFLLVRGDSLLDRPEIIAPRQVLGRAVIVMHRGRRMDLTTSLRSIEGVLVARTGAPRIIATRSARRLLAIFRALRRRFSAA